jgi:hypothetical protein
VLRGNHPQVAEELVNGTDVNAVDINGYTALHWAVVRGVCSPTMTLCLCHTMQVHWLVGHRADATSEVDLAQLAHGTKARTADLRVMAQLVWRSLGMMDVDLDWDNVVGRCSHTTSQFSQSQLTTTRSCLIGTDARAH